MSTASATSAVLIEEEHIQNFADDLKFGAATSVRPYDLRSGVGSWGVDAIEAGGKKGELVARPFLVMPDRASGALAAAR